MSKHQTAGFIRLLHRHQFRLVFQPTEMKWVQPSAGISSPSELKKSLKLLGSPEDFALLKVCYCAKLTAICVCRENRPFASADFWEGVSWNGPLRKAAICDATKANMKAKSHLDRFQRPRGQFNQKKTVYMTRLWSGWCLIWLPGTAPNIRADAISQSAAAWHKYFTTWTEMEMGPLVKKKEKKKALGPSWHSGGISGFTEGIMAVCEGQKPFSRSGDFP